ncbi:MAG TPA: DMT family transporter [Acidimicrobiales bacterium]|nr:DMT family transporter [Acidimicrobiales bacterium]
MSAAPDATSPGGLKALRSTGSAAVASLVAVTAVWGSTFVIVKTAVERMPVMDFLAWRFALATAVMVVVRPKALLALGRAGWVHAILLGLALGAGYVTQTYGLQHTSAADSGFITGMCAVFTPIIAWVVLRRRISGPTWGAVAVATVGLGVLSLHGLHIGLGDSLTLACAVAYAVQVVGLAEWSAGHDVYALAAAQLLTVTVCTTAVAVPTVGLGPPPDAFVWVAVAVTAVLATALAFLVQTWAQALISATRASITLTMEPVFAGLTAWIAGESLGWRVPVGGALVVSAMFLADADRRPGRGMMRLSRIRRGDSPRSR